MQIGVVTRVLGLAIVALQAVGEGAVQIGVVIEVLEWLHPASQIQCLAVVALRAVGEGAVQISVATEVLSTPSALVLAAQHGQLRLVHELRHRALEHWHLQLVLGSAVSHFGRD